MIRVAASVVLMAGLHSGPRRPGFYLGVGGLNVGLCRNDERDRAWGSRHQQLGKSYQAGARGDEGLGRIQFGVEAQDVSVILTAGGSRQWVIW